MTPRSAGVQRHTSEPAHAGEELRLLREQVGMTVHEVAARANVDPATDTKAKYPLQRIDMQTQRREFS